MKTTRLTTFWDAGEVITLIGMIDDIRDALVYTYHAEIEQHQHQLWLEQKKCRDDNLDPFDDNIDF